MPEHDDLWWAVHPGTDLDQVGEEIAEAVVRYGAPRLRRVGSDESLLRAWKAGESGYILAPFAVYRMASVLAAKLGTLEDLDKFVGLALREAEGMSAAESFAKEWLAALADWPEPWMTSEKRALIQRHLRLRGHEARPRTH